jgi:Putative Actinobacterial Holin-X, holin superfamily III
MFAPLFSAVRADLDRQIEWAKVEVRRQARHTVLILILAGVAAFAGFGAAVVGLIALYTWLAMEHGQFIALGMIGGGLLLLALILLALALVRRRPRVASPPPLQIAQPVALLGTLGQGRNVKVVTGGQQLLNLATDTLRNGSRSALFGTLALVALVGLIAARRLRDRR